MLETPIPPLVISLAIPTVISMLVTSIYNMADTYFVSQINTSASGAVGIVFSIMAAIQAFGFMVGMGAGSISARLLGQNKGDEASVYSSSAVLTALILGVFFAGLGLLFLEPLIWLLGSTETIFPYAIEYARYILLGAPVMVLAYTLNNLLRWQGLAYLSVIGLAIGGIINMILDPIFIFVFDLGIGGAGAATLLSQCISLLILISFFVLGKSELRVARSCISRSPQVYLSIFKQGMPSFFRQAVFSFGISSLNFNAKPFDDAAVAAMSIVSRVFMVASSIVIGFGQGFQPVLGYNYGAGKNDRVKQTILYSLKVCTGILLAAALLGYLFAPQIITVFRRDDAQVIAIGTQALRFQALTLPLGAVLTFANMLFQSLGKSWRATILAVCRQGLFIPLVFFLRWHFGLTGLQVAQPVADLLAFLIAAPIMLHYFLREFDQPPE